MSLSSSFSAARPLALVGAGKMGGALLTGWLAHGLDAKSVLVIDPSPPPESVTYLKSVGIRAVGAVPADADARVVVVAVKPQVIKDILPTLRPLVGRDTIVVSIAAGTTLKQLEAGVGGAAVVRTMPNTPAQVGRGVTAAVPNGRVSKANRALVDELLSAVGQVVWLPDEKLIDAVTAVSGSGPAYVFHMVEALAAAGVAAGLDVASATQLARATVTGAGELLHQSPLDAGILRQNVTSPNGTTQAALKVLMGRGGLTALMKKAVAAAKKRSRELSA